MNIYLMVDIEGISGIFSRAQVISGESRYTEGRKYMTDDINACIKGLKAAGVDKIYVQDAHGGSNMVEWANLSNDADYYVCGYRGNKRFPGLENCDAVILMGYHAMAGTAQAVLEHSFSSSSVQNMFLDGEKVGEIAIDTAISGEYNKPVIMVTGDDKTCLEAEKFIPNVVTCEVKKGMSSFGAMLIPREKAHKLIYDKTIEAVKNYKNVQPYNKKGPHSIRVELMERQILPNPMAKPNIEIIDGRTFEARGETVEEAFSRVF